MRAGDQNQVITEFIKDYLVYLISYKYRIEKV